jgi:hypothetical protein
VRGKKAHRREVHDNQIGVFASLTNENIELDGSLRDQRTGGEGGQVLSEERGERPGGSCRCIAGSVSGQELPWGQGMVSWVQGGEASQKSSSQSEVSGTGGGGGT